VATSRIHRTSLSLQEISDRLLIQDVVEEESAAIDERDWDRWEAVYVPGARIDWTDNGAIAGDPVTVRAWASQVLSDENFPYPQYQHFCTNFEIAVEGDRATCRHMQLIPISVPSGGPDGGRQIAFSGIWFDDVLVRTPEGWRIEQRTEKLAWHHNFPEAFQVPEA
jgi:hypothetical protein